MSGDLGLVAAIVQARMTSTRLPGKVMKNLVGAPLIRRMLERALCIKGLDRVVVALAEGAPHDPVIDAVAGLPVMVVRGSEQDVLARSAAAARAAGADTVMRITSDCPLVDPRVSASVLAAYQAAHLAGVRYARTRIESGFPLGFDTEVFPAAALYEAEEYASDPYEREHVTPYIWQRPELYPAVILDAKPDRRHWRLVVDTPEDYCLMSAVYDTLYPTKPTFGFAELIELFAQRPALLEMNAHIGGPVYLEPRVR
jgi:spore coat polysaccharide biosynthesis protein SpsF